MKLENKKVLITGGGSGIGSAMATRFAQAGAHVSILELSEESASEVVKTIRLAGGQVDVYAVDVSDHESVNDVIQNCGEIDILINNAGIAHVGSLCETDVEDLDRVYEVNVKGVYNCMHAVVPVMVANGGGVILNMASIASKMGLGDRFAYSMSKGAVLTMTYSVAKDYINSGIRCNCICPARVHTPFVDGFLAKNYPDDQEAMFSKLSEFQPVGRMGKPEEIASLALFLCSDEASFITGAAYDIDGGVTTLR